MAREASKAQATKTRCQVGTDLDGLYYGSDYGPVRLSPALAELMGRARKVWELESAIETIMRKAHESGVEIEEL